MKEKLCIYEGMEKPLYCLFRFSESIIALQHILSLFKKIKVELAFDLAILLLGICPKEMKSVCYRDGQIVI